MAALCSAQIRQSRQNKLRKIFLASAWDYNVFGTQSFLGVLILNLVYSISKNSGRGNTSPRSVYGNRSD
jgi:hypothetical protein